MKSKQPIIVKAANYLEFNPGGWYDLSHGNDIERRIAKLVILRRWILETENCLSESGENMTEDGAMLEKMADHFFEKVRPAIESGYDVFGREQWWNKEYFTKYMTRPHINGYDNAAPSETESGLPEGWWWNFPGYATKMFEDRFIVIGTVDGYPRIDILDPHDEENLPYLLTGDYGAVVDSLDCDEREGSYEHLIDVLLPPDIAAEAKQVVHYCEMSIEGNLA